MYADNFLCGKINYVEDQDVYKVNCASDSVENVFATNVKIKAAPNQYLTLCEVLLSEKNKENRFLMTKNAA